MLAKLLDVAFDLLGDFRQRRGAIRSGEFEAAVFSRVVTGSKIDGPVRPAPQNLIGDGGGRSCVLAIERLNSLGREQLGTLPGECVRLKASIVAHNQTGVGLGLLKEFGHGRCHKPRIFESEILGDDGSPARGSEFDLAHNGHSKPLGTAPDQGFHHEVSKR